MSLTRSQLHERITDLSGQYRAAQENKRLTSQKRAEDERLADLSRQADEKADGYLLDVAAKIRDAQAQYAAAVDEMITGVATLSEPVDSEWVQRPGEEPVLPINVFNNELYDTMLENAESRVNGAFERATQ